MQDQTAPAFLVWSGTASFEEFDRMRVEAYWTAVSETMRTVLGVQDARLPIEGLRSRLEDAAPQTRLMFYHTSPIQVASDLVAAHAGELTEAQTATYRDIIARLEAFTVVP